MPFTKDQLENKAIRDTALTFDQLCLEGTGIPDDVGYEILPDGDIELRLFLPNAKDVKVIAQMAGELPIKKREDGMLTALLPYAENAAGPETIDVVVDGTVLLYPYWPIYWTGNRPCNYVEVPEPDASYWMLRDVPHGAMIHERFWSESTGNWERCTVYTPAGYMNGNESYPVLYLQNGGTDNETSWEYSGRVAHIMDNLIADKKAVPCIVVMNNAMLRTGGRVSSFRDRGLERLIVEDCLPYIEANYRVKTDKWNRAIAGLSMGAYMTCDIAFWHPELFGYLGTFTTSMTTKETWEQYERPYHEFIRDARRFAETYRVYFRSTTQQENHFGWFLDDDVLCRENGLDALSCYYRKVYSEQTSKWSSWRMGLRDFAQLIFHEA